MTSANLTDDGGAGRAGWLGRILMFLVWCYQKTLSPLLPYGVCIYEPTCSHYMIQAIRIHGPWRGVALGLWRICRCHPYARGGRDPVPGTETREGSAPEPGKD